MTVVAMSHNELSRYDTLLRVMRVSADGTRH
jgi:hypothetical protein